YPQGPGYPPQRQGSGVKAFLLSWLTAGIGAMLFAGILFLSYEDLSKIGLRLMYLVFAIALAVAVGGVAGRMGGPNPAAYIAPAALAMVACITGVANGYLFSLMDAGGSDALDAMMEHEPFAPLKFWWEGTLKEGFALLGLAIAGGGAFGMASLIGKKQR
ncbi:hypothetical protein, partial [Streptomyces boncukensis]